jgi:hypothetical protein
MESLATETKMMKEIIGNLSGKAKRKKSRKGMSIA